MSTQTLLRPTHNRQTPSTLATVIAPRQWAQPAATVPAAETPDLTRRQLELLQLIVDGEMPKQAARTMGISVRTVHNHLNAIYRLLDVNALVHAVVVAVRLGLVTMKTADDELAENFDHANCRVLQAI